MRDNSLHLQSVHTRHDNFHKVYANIVADMRRLMRFKYFTFAADKRHMIELVNSVYQPNVKLVNWICGRPRSMVISLWLNVLSGIDKLISKTRHATLYFEITFHFHNCKSVLSARCIRIIPFLPVIRKKKEITTDDRFVPIRRDQQVLFIALIMNLNRRYRLLFPRRDRSDKR